LSSHPLKTLSQKAWVKRLLSHVPPGVLGRFLSIGLLNTLFAYSSFAVLAYLFGRYFPAYGFVLAALISGFANVTFSFLTYKWFVFRTRGNYLIEWIRCTTVYSGGIVINTALLPVVVFALRALTPMYAAAPYVGAAILIVVTTIVNFFAHKEFSFKQRTVQPDKP